MIKKKPLGFKKEPKSWPCTASLDDAPLSHQKNNVFGMDESNVFSSVAGSIKMLLMAAPDLSDQDQIDRIVALQKVLQDDTGLVVWCNCAADRDKLWEIIRLYLNGADVLKGDAESPLPSRFRVLLIAPAQATEKYSHWVRDPFLFFQRGKRSVGLVKSKAAKVEDGTWANKYIGKLNIENLLVSTNDQIFLPIAGGNMLFDQGFILIGYHQVASYYASNGRSQVDDQIKKSLEAQAGFKRVIAIGEKAANEPGLLPHIDLYLTLTGRRDTQTGKYIVLLGECFILNEQHRSNTDTQNIAKGINRYLDSVLEQLVAEGFEVIRTPLPLIGKEPSGKTYLCTYNNCLVSCGALSKTVWLPRYTFGIGTEPWYEALKTAEDKCASIWESMVYEVRFVDANFHSIVDDNGSLHCITQELLRWV